MLIVTFQRCVFVMLLSSANARSSVAVVLCATKSTRSPTKRPRLWIYGPSSYNSTGQSERTQRLENSVRAAPALFDLSIFQGCSTGVVDDCVPEGFGVASPLIGLQELLKSSSLLGRAILVSSPLTCH